MRRLTTRSVLAAAWVLAILGWLAALAAEAAFSNMGEILLCELTPGSSIYGKSSWSLTRLGAVCTYELDPPGITVIEAPTLRWVVTGLLLLWGLTLRRWRQATTRTDEDVTSNA